MTLILIDGLLFPLQGINKNYFDVLIAPSPDFSIMERVETIVGVVVAA